MNKTFAVLGAGKFGSNLARQLYEDGCEVLVVDHTEAHVNEIADYVTHAVIGDTTDERFLSDIGIRDFYYVIISLASDIRASVITTVLCKELGAKYIIAKATDDLHAKLLLKTGADKVIRPEKEAGIRLAKSLVSGNFIDYLELSDTYSVHEIHIPKAWIGQTLLKLDVRRKYDVSVIGIRRGEDILVTLDPNAPLRQGDVLILIGANSGFEKISHLEV